MSAHRLALTAVALALAVAGVAQAKLPSPSSHLIVPGKSIGGVILGHSFASAKTAWGSGGTCLTARAFSSCTYSASKTKSLGQAGFSADNGKIASVSIGAGTSATGKPVIPASLKLFKTANGIGLGATTSQVQTKYPHIKSTGTLNLYISGPGKANTTFTLTKGKVTSINVNNGHGG